MKNLLFVALGLSLTVLAACSGGISKVEKDMQKDLDEYRERHVLVLKTGEVTLPAVSQLPHEKYPNGGRKLEFANLYIVNLGFMGRTFVCQGCDSCMTCYQKAGLITYDVKERNDQTVVANVELTSKGKKYLIENYVGGYPEIEEWRNNDHVELMLVSTEKFELDIKKSADGSETYFCEARRCLDMTPFLEAIGGQDRDENTDKYPHKYKIVYDEENKADIDRID